MAEPESLHGLELAVKSLEGKIDTLTAKVDGKFDNVLELIRHGDSENQARIEGVAAKVDAMKEQLGEEVKARGDMEERLAQRLADEAKARGDLDQRLARRAEDIDQWRSSLGVDFPTVIQYVRDSKAQLRLWRAFGASTTAVMVALVVALLTKVLRVG